MTVIGILGSQLLTTQKDPFYWNQVVFTRKRLLDAIQILGHSALVLPVDAPEKAADLVSRVDKILLSGGNDLSPDTYFDLPHELLGITDPARDAFELAAIHAAIAQKKPLFGICRGMQMLNVSQGGTLFQDITLCHEISLEHWQKTDQETPSHTVTVKSDSLLSFLPELHAVNSFHHQAIHKLAPNLTAIATAPDGIIEAVENKDLRLLAVQWHPECTFSSQPLDLEIFRYFIEEL